MSVEAELKSAFTEVGAQVKSRTAPGSLNTWGIVPVAIIPKNGTIPTPLPTWGLVVELST